MTLDEAIRWLEELDQAVASGKINQYQAWEHVFSEMEGGGHDRATEDLFYNYTRKE